MNDIDISNDFQLTICIFIENFNLKCHCRLKSIRNTQITFKSLFFFHSSFSKSQQSFFHNSFFLNYSIKNMYMNCLSISATLIFYACVCSRFTQSQHFTTKNIDVSFIGLKKIGCIGIMIKKTRISSNQIADWIIIYLR